MAFPKFGLQGKARPADFSGQYNQLLFMMRQVLSKVNTAALCEVLAVYGGGVAPVGFVDLQPLVNQVDGYGNAIPQGVLHNIPYMRMQGGVNAIILDPQVNDIGVCVFADRDISSVKATGKKSNPNSRRKFDVADGLYLGGMLNGTPTNFIEFLSDRIIINSDWIDLTGWVGMLAPFAMGSVPQGWLACPTAQTLVSTTTYAALFAKLQYAWGGSGGSFGIPYLPTGYTFVAGGIAALTHGQVLDHIHNTAYAVYNQSANASLGAASGGSTQTVIATTNPTNGPHGSDNLAAGLGAQWCVKY